MNTTFASPAEGRKVLVWDAPLRVFHWLLASSFAGAWLTAESESWRLVHVTLGYTMAGLIVFRVVWGFVGPRHARFSDFVRGPAAVLRYLRSLLGTRPEHHVGHNPSGGLAVLALLALGALTAASGFIHYQDWGGDMWEEAHEALAGLMLAVVAIHVAAVVLTSVLHRENLVRAMVTGRKQGRPADGIRRARGGTAVLLVAAVLGFWWLQWQDAPTTVAAAGAVQARAHHHEDDD